MTNPQQAGYYFDNRRPEGAQVIENLLAVAERCLEVFDTEGARYALLQVGGIRDERDIIDECASSNPHARQGI